MPSSTYNKVRKTILVFYLRQHRNYASSTFDDGGKMIPGLQ